MSRIQITVAATVLLAAAAGASTADAAGNVLTSSPRTYLYVPGDLAGGGVVSYDAPAPLLGQPMAAVAQSALNTARSGDNGFGRTGTSSSQDTASAGYGLLSATASAIVTTLGNPFQGGES